MQLRNPIQPSEFVDDGQIVVDVIVTDASGEVFQVEMQSWNHAALGERMLYAWATLQVEGDEGARRSVRAHVHHGHGRARG